jgi:hypothetical protein
MLMKLGDWKRIGSDSDILAKPHRPNIVGFAAEYYKIVIKLLLYRLLILDLRRKC